MRTLLYAGVVHRACEVCSEKWPCAEHPETGVGERRQTARGTYDGKSCTECGYHVCSCPVDEEEFFKGTPFDPARGAEAIGKALAEGMAEALRKRKPVDPHGWHRGTNGAWERNCSPVFGLMRFFWALHRRRSVSEWRSAAWAAPRGIPALLVRWDEQECAYLLRGDDADDKGVHDLRAWSAVQTAMTSGRWVHQMMLDALVWRPYDRPPPDWAFLSAHSKKMKPYPGGTKA